MQSKLSVKLSALATAVALLALGACSSSSSSAPADLSPEAAAGREISISAGCASCHGEDGKGNGAASGGLVPKPRNFHETAWQAKVDDAHIAGVISKGGAAYGLSGSMPPWGAVLSQEEIDGMVKKIRLWGKK